jgi:sigma-B regulation protein RsbU (phosphoserine phosphatase)
MNFELRRTADIIITFFVGLIDPQAGTLTYVNAGHCHPLLSSGGAIRELLVSGPSLGYADSVEYQVGVEELRKGDLLFTYSDGLVELAGADGSCENVDVDQVLRDTADGPDFNRRVINAVLASSASKAFSDDVTIVTARIL